MRKPGEDEEDENANAKSKVGGFVLEYDAARKIAQGLGAHLEQLASLIEVKGATARLLPVAERTRSLFQKGDAAAPIEPRQGKEERAPSSPWGSWPISRRQKRAVGGAIPEHHTRVRLSSIAFTSP